MSTYRNAYVGVVLSDSIGGNLYISNNDITIDGIKYDECITDITFVNAQLDPISNSISRQTISISFAIDNNFRKEVISMTKAKVSIAYDTNIYSSANAEMPGIDRYYSDTKTVYRLRNTIDTINTFEGRVEVDSYIDGVITIKIVIIDNTSYDDRLIKFTKDTFGQYTTFRGMINRLEKNIIIPDFSPSSAFPFGRYLSDVVDEHTYSELGGVVTPDSASIDTLVFNSSFNMNDSLMAALSTSNRRNLVFRLDDYLNSLKSFNDMSSDQRVPVAKLVASHAYGPTADGRSGIELIYAFDDTNSEEAAPLDLYTQSAYVEYSRTRYGAFVFVRTSRETSTPVEFDYESLIQDLASGYKIAPYALLYDKIVIRIDDDDASTINTDRLVGSSLSSIQSDLIDLGADPYKSYLYISVFDALDLRDEYRNRWGGVIFNHGTVNPSIVETTIGSATLVTEIPSGPSRSGEVTALFDPEILFEDGSGNRLLFTEKWYACAVPLYETVKELMIPLSAISGIPASTLVKQRIDAVRTDEMSNVIINIVDPIGQMNTIEVQHADVMNVSNGMFAYIDTVRTIISNETLGETMALITLKSPRQGDPETSTSVIPNTMSRVTSEDFNSMIYLFEFRTPPQNSSDEGKFIPIVYGKVEKFPAINAISKKANGDSQDYAGDDTYIMCSHPIAQRDHNSITIYWGLDELENSTSPSLESRSQIAAMEDRYDLAKPHLIPNPFPVAGKINIITNTQITNRVGGIDYVYNMVNSINQVVTNPLHYLVTVEDNNHNIHTGFRLRGDEIDPAHPDNDIRFNLKNGLNSKMFVTFNGMADDLYGTYTGVPYSPIIHPAHIIKHILTNYSNYDIAKFDATDISIHRAFSKTNERKLGVYIQEEGDIFSLLEMISKNSFIYTISTEGRYVVGYLDLDNKQSSVYTFNELTDVFSVNSEYTFDAITNYTFNYSKSFASSRYNKSLLYNTSNNKLCNDVLKSTGVTKTKEINLEYVFDDYTAKQVAIDYVKLHSIKRTILTVTSTVNIETKNLEIFDCVSIKHEDVYDYMNSKIGVDQTNKFVITGKKLQVDSFVFVLTQIK